ncbi:hypothetical protein YPPY66_1978, partial [Yersinia pestis PY-66]
MIRSVAP